MAFSQEYSFEGFGQMSPVSLAITGTRTAVTVASYAVPSIPSALGLSAAALVGVVGIALAAVSMIYNYITGNQQRKKIEHKLANQYIEDSIKMGKEVLVSYGYNPELVNRLPIGGLYSIPNLYEDKQALMNVLSIYGVDASRFIYEAPVLKPEFTGNIERDLRVRELLTYMGYNQEELNKTDWRINVNTFDALHKLSTTSTKEEANIQIERINELLLNVGLDPTKFMETLLPSKTTSDIVPSPTAVVTDTALQISEVEVQKTGFSISPIIIAIGISILLLSRIK